MTSIEAKVLRTMGAQIWRIRQIRHITQEELTLKAGYDLTADDIDSLEKGENNMLIVRLRLPL